MITCQGEPNVLMLKFSGKPHKYCDSNVHLKAHEAFTDLNSRTINLFFPQ